MLFTEHHLFGYLLALFIGLGCGSYATMPAHRLPRGEAAGGRWVGPRSKCPSCGVKLRTRDLVPVFNWLLTRGQCHFCGVKISLNYLFIEATTAAVSLLLYWQFNISEQYLLLMGLGTCLVILLSTDWHHKMFPKQVLYAIAFFGVAYRVLKDGELFYMVNSSVAAFLIAFAVKGYVEEKRKSTLKRPDYLWFIALGGIWLNEAELLTAFLLGGAMWLLLKAGEAISRKSIPAGVCLVLPLFLHVAFPVQALVFYWLRMVF